MFKSIRLLAIATLLNAPLVTPASAGPIRDFLRDLLGRAVELESRVDALEQPPPKTVFVTSVGYNGDLATAGGSLNGLQGADNLCDAHAASGNVPPGPYVAWLSTTRMDAWARLPANDQGYVLQDGTTVVATSKADLLDGMLQSPIFMDESGVHVGDVRVRTGTDEAGLLTSQGSCLDWQDGTVIPFAVFGSTARSDRGWTRDHFLACDFPLRLYCFEQ